MASDRRISPDPLCLVVEDLDGTFAVCDGRGGELLSRHTTLRGAASAAAHMNGRYATGAVPPAADTLAHELAQKILILR
jgi:hypothetical protein